MSRDNTEMSEAFSLSLARSLARHDSTSILFVFFASHAQDDKLPVESAVLPFLVETKTNSLLQLI